MKISAKVENSYGKNTVAVTTNDSVQTLAIPGRSTGFGSAVNGGEFLFLALATCFCNDIYREAGKRNIKITKVEVEVSGEFIAEGKPGNGIIYKANVEGDASDDELLALKKYTDTVSEIQNTLRIGVPVVLME